MAREFDDMGDDDMGDMGNNYASEAKDCDSDDDYIFEVKG